MTAAHIELMEQSSSSQTTWCCHVLAVSVLFEAAPKNPGDSEPRHHSFPRGHRHHRGLEHTRPAHRPAVHSERYPRDKIFQVSSFSRAQHASCQRFQHPKRMLRAHVSMPLTVLSTAAVQRPQCAGQLRTTKKNFIGKNVSSRRVKRHRNVQPIMSVSFEIRRHRA